MRGCSMSRRRWPRCRWFCWRGCRGRTWRRADPHRAGGEYLAESCIARHLGRNDHQVRRRPMAQQSTKRRQAAKAERKVVHGDIKLNSDPKLATRFLDVPNMPWEKTKFPGIEIKVLYSDDEGKTTALFKLAPGAVVPLHEHTALEQTYVI